MKLFFSSLLLFSFFIQTNEQGKIVDPVPALEIKEPEETPEQDIPIPACIEKNRVKAEKKILIAVPTYNEKETIEKLYNQLKEFAPDADILIIDDNSPDGTGALIDTLAEKDSQVKTMHRAGKLGLGTAQCASYGYAREHGYDFLITMDADGTHDPKYIPEMRAALTNDFDIIIGSRYAEGAEMQNWGKFRLALTKFWRGCLKLGTGMSCDSTGAYRLYRVEILDPEIYTSITSPGFSFGLEFLFKLHGAGARIGQVGIIASGRAEGAGESKLSSTEMWQMVKSYMYLIRLRLFSRAPKKKFSIKETQPAPEESDTELITV